MRARNIKPAFWENEVLGAMPADRRLTFIGLWCLADREGRLEDRPARIAGLLFPFQAERPDMEAILEELTAAEFILRYAAEGKRLIQIATFRKHQFPNLHERPSTIPAPPESARACTCKHSNARASECLHSNAPLDPGTLDPGSWIRDPGSGILKENQLSLGSGAPESPESHLDALPVPKAQAPVETPPRATSEAYGATDEGPSTAFDRSFRPAYQAALRVWEEERVKRGLAYRPDGNALNGAGRFAEMIERDGAKIEDIRLAVGYRLDVEAAERRKPPTNGKRIVYRFATYAEKFSELLTEARAKVAKVALIPVVEPGQPRRL